MKLSHEQTMPLLGIYPEETLMETDTCTHVHCSSLYHGQDTEATKAYIWLMTGWKISPSADHSIQTKTLASPLAHSRNRRVSLRSPRDEDREMWSERLDVEHPQPPRFSPCTRKPQTLPCQPEAAPTDLVSHFPEMSQQVSCQNAWFSQSWK